MKNTIMDVLQKADLITDLGAAETTLSCFTDNQPWYIRAMVGFGAWLSSLFFLGFIVAASFNSEAGLILFGLVLIVVGCGLRHVRDGDFVIQICLALGLSGQTMLIYGLTRSIDYGRSYEVALQISFLLSLGLFWVFPDRVMRVLQVLFASAATLFLCYVWGVKMFIPWLGPAAAAGVLCLAQTRAAWMSRGHFNRLLPLQIGLLLAACGYVSISTVYLLPELFHGVSLYPNPWISTLFLGVLFLFSTRDVWPQILPSTHQWLGWIFATLVIVASWANPGLLLALLILVIGTRQNSLSLKGFGLAYLVGHLTLYFYGIQVTLLIKSVTLVGTGALLLGARQLVKQVNLKEAHHA